MALEMGDHVGIRLHPMDVYRCPGIMDVSGSQSVAVP